MEENRKEFEEKFCLINYNSAGKPFPTMSLTSDEVEELWQWIEQKLIEAKVEENQRYLDAIEDIIRVFKYEIKDDNSLYSLIALNKFGVADSLKTNFNNRIKELKGGDAK